jgi:hypothetical protein
MYEGLVSSLINRCTGPFQRYEIILELLENPKPFTTEEKQLLITLLDREQDVDDKGRKRIDFARLELQPYIEFEEMLTSEEVEILEGKIRRLLIYSVLAFGVVDAGSYRSVEAASACSTHSSADFPSVHSRQSSRSGRSKILMGSLAKLPELHESITSIKNSRELLEKSSSAQDIRAQRQEEQKVSTSEGALLNDVALKPLPRKISWFEKGAGRVGIRLKR